MTVEAVGITVQLLSPPQFAAQIRSGTFPRVYGQYHSVLVMYHAIPEIVEGLAPDGFVWLVTKKSKGSCQR